MKFNSLYFGFGILDRYKLYSISIDFLYGLYGYKLKISYN